MKIKILTFVIILTTVGISLPMESFGQTVYEVVPGTKGNEITITLSNISEMENATNILVKPVKIFASRESKGKTNYTFNKESQIVDSIKAGEEKAVTFKFDINISAPVNKQDTIDFMISSDNGVMLQKTFVIKYSAPKEFSLSQNYPNPFNPTTKIRYTIPDVGTSLMKSVQLKVYDILGSEVTTLVNNEQDAGYYEVNFDGSRYASGVYIYRLVAGDYVSTKKMIMIK